MTDDTALGLDVLVLVAGGAALAIVLVIARNAVDVVPISKERREAARRAMPIVSALAAMVYGLYVVRRLFAGQPEAATASMVLVLATFVIASWASLRDISSGVFIKAGRVCREGDTVTVDELEGRVMHMGLRVLVLETADGEEAIVPYHRIARGRLLRTPAAEGLSPHMFRVPLPDAGSTSALKDEIRRRAMLVHWSAASREPEVTLDGEALEVTVYSVDPERGPDIEAEVRRELAAS